MTGRAGIQRILVLVCGVFLLAGHAAAQGFPVYKEPLPVASLDPDRLFSESLAGQAILDDSRQKTVALSEENRRIESQLEQEERKLTEQRKTLPGDEFRKLAEAFDQKVVRIRREQNAKAAKLGQELDAARRGFSERVQPILQQLMLDLGIIFLLDDQAIVLAVRSGDITDEALERINAEIDATLDLGK